jgi:hypothetical protein
MTLEFNGGFTWCEAGGNGTKHNPTGMFHCPVNLSPEARNTADAPEPLHRNCTHAAKAAFRVRGKPHEYSAIFRAAVSYRRLGSSYRFRCGFVLVPFAHLSAEQANTIRCEI